MRSECAADLAPAATVERCATEIVRKGATIEGARRVPEGAKNVSRPAQQVGGTVG